MSPKLEVLSSPEALQAFKSKIGESLSFLGYLNENDKSEAWKFWKTVSSAVKIALNGKGDVTAISKRSKAFECQNKESDHKIDRNLEREAISINLPPIDNSTQNGNISRFKVIKISNDNSVTNCAKNVPLTPHKKEVNDPDTERATEGERQVHDNVQNAVKIDLHNQDILQDVTVPDVCNPNASNSSLISSCQENIHQSSPQENDTGQHHKGKKVKIWPISRPATRSVSKSNNMKSGRQNITLKRDITEHSNESCIHITPSISDCLSTKRPDTEEYSATILSISEHEAMQSLIDARDSEKVKVSSNAQQECDQITSIHLDASSNPEDFNCESKQNKTSLLHAEQISEEPEITNAGIQLVDHNNISDISTATQVMQIKIEDPGRDNNSHIGFEFKPNEEGMHQVHVQGHLGNKSTSDIETIISALEAELKKAGGDVGSISITSGKDGTTEVVTGANDQLVQFIPNQEIMEIQSSEHVIWASGGEIPVTSHQTVVDTTTSSSETVPEGNGVGPPIEAQYDVVEYEVFADKEKASGNGGRKRKNKISSQEKDVLDRTCPMCHRVLTYASSMAAHMRIHTGDRPYSCGQCDRKFTTKANRDRHEATHVGLKPFKCTECHKSFTEKRSLKIHMRSHTGERPFVCSTCDRGFAQKCTLQVHMDRHANKKGHLCDLCGKAFRQKCQLDIHVKRHNRQANHPCTQCSVKCYTRGDLMRHMIKHTGERPYQCSLCSRTFTRKQYLMDHENTHYGRKPYKCSICSQAFHDMGSCHRHVRKHRNEAEEANGDKSKKVSSLLSTEDFDLILKGSQTGQILTLEDGTKALIKAVESEADGSIVYHISCIGDDFTNTNSESNESESLVLPTIDKSVFNSKEALSVSPPSGSVDQ